MSESLKFQLEVDEPLLREYTTMVSADLEYFRGHFPDHPVLSGVAQLEALVLELAGQAWPDLGSLRELRRLKFHRLILPNSELRIELQRKKRTRISFTISLNADSQKCSSGVLCYGGQRDVG